MGKRGATLQVNTWQSVIGRCWKLPPFLGLTGLYHLFLWDPLRIQMFCLHFVSHFWIFASVIKKIKKILICLIKLKRIDNNKNNDNNNNNKLSLYLKIKAYKPPNLSSCHLYRERNWSIWLHHRPTNTVLPFGYILFVIVELTYKNLGHIRKIIQFFCSSFDVVSTLTKSLELYIMSRIDIWFLIL